EELASVGVAIQLYPLSAFRAANKAAENVYNAIRTEGHQKSVIDSMQTRAELYDRIGYHAFEQKLDALFAAGKKWLPAPPDRACGTMIKIHPVDLAAGHKRRTCDERQRIEQPDFQAEEVRCPERHRCR